MPRPPPSPIPLLVAASCYAAIVAILCLSILWGLDKGMLDPRPAAVGVAVVTAAVLLGAFLSLSPRDSLPTNLEGSVAFGLVGLLLLGGFVFGPLSLFIVSGVPVTALVVTARLGPSWGRPLLMFGTLGGLVVVGGAASGLWRVAPAFVDPGLRDAGPVYALQTTMLLLSAALVAMVELTPRVGGTSVIDTVVPAPPRRTARTGSYSLSELALLDQSAEDIGEEVQDEGLELQKLESLGVLAGGVAHDFNNLLMSILGNTSLALNDLEPGHMAEEPLREIETASKRARDLVGQLLAYAGKGNVAPSPVDLNHLVREMGDLLQTAMKARAPVTYDLCPGTPVVMGDPTQLRQVVMNLITNAGDAMKGRQGQVTVSTRIRKVPEDELAPTLLGAECNAGVYVVLTCRDHGSGMDAATLERIFEPFYTTKRTGRGLGLAAVLGIVRRCGGTMLVESKVDEGSSFRLYLPFADSVDEDEDFVTDPTSTARGWSDGHGGPVLVVDDDPVVRLITRRMLQRLGFTVEEAEDGQQAIDRFDEGEPYRVVVLDVTMPGLSGIETLEALRHRRPELPVVLVSGYSEAEVPSMHTGVFLQKPYTLKQLTVALDDVLEEG